jgi:hypothetical protein
VLELAAVGETIELHDSLTAAVAAVRLAADGEVNEGGA